MARARPHQRCRAGLGRPGVARRRRDSPSRARSEHERARRLARHPAAPDPGQRMLRRRCAPVARTRPASATSFVPMRALKRAPRMPCSAAGCGSSNPGADIASAMTPSCWRRRARRARGERVVDLGAGVGAAGLALALRVDGSEVTLVEIDAGLAALAAENARAQRTCRAGACPSCSTSRRRRAPSRRRGSRRSRSTRVLMNPPFNDPARQRASPDRQRRLAHAGPAGTLARLDQDRRRGCCVRAAPSP